VSVNGIITSNCGEQWLGPYDACNLGSINLGLFVKDGQVDWAGLEATTRDCTRFLDDVIDVNPYPLAEIREKVHNNRRIGLGVMGWADMLFQLGIRYDSDEAIALGERVMVSVRDWATDESIRMAAERGPFPNWERSIYQHDAPRRNSTCTTVAPTGSISIIADCSSGIEPIFALAFQHRVKQPDGSYRVLDFVNPFFVRALEASDIADKAGVLAWVKEHGALHGHPAAEHPALAAFVTAHEVAPDWHIRMQAAFQKGVDNSISKCLAAGTLIATSHGLIPVEDFSDIDEPDTFVQIAGRSITIDGHRVLSHYYAGEKPATRIRLDNGAELVGATASHRVLTPDGWKLMAELRPGDLVIGRSMMSHGAGGARLPQTGMYVTNAKRVIVPERMSSDLALFLGMLAADGHTTIETGAVGLTSASEEALAEFARLAQTLFGMTPRHLVDKRNPNVQYLTLNSRVLCRWVEELIGKGAYAKVVPPQILNGSAEEKLAFLRGLSLDGYRRENHGLYIYAGMSERLAYGVAELCRSFGLPEVRQERVTVAYNGNTAHKVVLSNEMQELVTCIEPHKNGSAHYATYQVLVDREVVNQMKLPTGHPFYSAFRSIKQRQAVNCDNRTAERLGWKSDVPVHRVTAVEDAGILSLYDIEVEDAHEYVVNGVVSHNTINLPNSATHADVEHAYMLAWDLGCLGITIFRDGSKGEQVLNVGVKKDAKAGAAEAQAANSAPVVADPLQAATPPAVAVPDAEPAVPAPAAAPTATVPAPAAKRHYTNGVKDRPEMVQGYTRRVRAPEGSVYVTLNSDEDGLLEVFITVGKAGSDVAALADALGRLISLQLRTESPLTQNERARAVAEQLRAIGGSSSIGFGVDRVRSLPDAVAKAITQHLDSMTAREAGGDPQDEPPAPAAHDADSNGHTGGGMPTFPQMQRFAVIGNLCSQCGCNTLVYEEGCKKCMSCGYSEC
jgi:ribonucleoside-diphosphate reductase alpha chain